MSNPGAQEQITRVVLSWEGVTAYSHCFGGTEYRLGRRELDHVHGDYLIDIRFPTKVRDEVLTAGRAQVHHVLPDSGWVSFRIREPADVERAIALLRQSCELAVDQRDKRYC
jgi:hypothetical protein